MALTQAQRELAASRLRAEGDARGKNPAILTGEFDTFISTKPELLFEHPPSNANINSFSLMHGTRELPGSQSRNDWIESEKKLEQERVAHAMSVQGQQKPKYDPEIYGHFGKKEHVQALEDNRKLIQDQKKGSQLNTVFVPLAEPYPPSTKSIHDLRPMLLRDLRLNVRHHGRYLLVEAVADPVFDNSHVVTIVEDETGATEWLKFYHAQRNIGKESFPKDALIVIPEPFYNADKNKTSWHIRIDHPCDIGRVTPSWSQLPTSMKLKHLSLYAKTAEQWKAEGNEALKVGTAAGFDLAAHSYSEGLDCLEDLHVPLALDLLRNRAYAKLELGRYDAAKADALAAVSEAGDEATDKFNGLNYKAYRRAAWAAYKLRQYQEAEQLLKKCFKLKPSGDNEDAKQLLDRVLTRLQEQRSGEYDFPSIIKGLEKQSRIDVADFLSRTEVKESPGRGRGLFATKDIPKGDIIIVEKAAFILFDNDKDFYPAFQYVASQDKLIMNMGALWQSAVRELVRNPSRLPEVLPLYNHGYPRDPAEGTLKDSQTIMDVFHIHKILAHNVYSSATPSPDQAKKPFGFNEYTGDQNGGLWVQGAMMNHSCVPNAARSHVGDLMVIRATRPIGKGEEIFSQYRNDTDFEQRQVALEGPWGFTCNCPLCIVQSQDSREVRDQRRQLIKKFEELTSGGVMSIDFARNMPEALQVYDQMQATYDLERYKDVPMKELINMDEMFMQVWWLFKPNQLDETLDFIQHLAFNMGWVLDLNVPELTSRANSELDSRLVGALLVAANVKEKQGQVQTAKKLEALSVSVYQTINGVADGFREIKDMIQSAGSIRARSR